MLILDRVSSKKRCFSLFHVPDNLNGGVWPRGSVAEGVALGLVPAVSVILVKVTKTFGWKAQQSQSADIL